MEGTLSVPHSAPEGGLQAALVKSSEGVHLSTVLAGSGIHLLWARGHPGGFEVNDLWVVCPGWAEGGVECSRPQGPEG